MNPDKIEVIGPSVTTGANSVVSVNGYYYNVQETVDQILQLMIGEQVASDNAITATKSATPIPTTPPTPVPASL